MIVSIWSIVISIVCGLVGFGMGYLIWRKKTLPSKEELEAINNPDRIFEKMTLQENILPGRTLEIKQYKDINGLPILSRELGMSTTQQSHSSVEPHPKKRSKK